MRNRIVFVPSGEDRCWIGMHSTERPIDGSYDAEFFMSSRDCVDVVEELEYFDLARELKDALRRSRPLEHDMDQGGLEKLQIAFAGVDVNEG